MSCVIEDQPQPFNLPGYGLRCAKCGMELNRVYRTKTSDGFKLRERICQACGEVNTSAERVIASRGRFDRG